VALLVVSIGSTLGAAGVQPASGGPLDYCDPAATQFDPLDVPPGGSASVTVPRVRQRSIEVLGTGTRLLESGPRHARTAVVFMHGSPGSAADWAEFLPLVAGKHARAIAFDLAGFGHAAPAWGASPKLDAATRFLGSALRQLGVRRVHLVAHDISGPVGLEWGARHPRRLRSVTLFDTGLLLGYSHHQLAQLTRTPGAGESFWSSLNRASFGAGIQQGQTTPLPQEFVDRLYDDLDRETRCAIIALYRGSDEPEIRAFARHQADVLAQRRRRPALIIWGADDPYLPAAMAARQREGFPRARIEVFEKAGHWPFVDYSARVRKTMVPFIRRAIARDRRLARRAHARAQGR